jgi:hypothetical protein
MGTPDASVRLDGISVRYEPYNRRPSLSGFRVDDPDGARARERSFRWSASDPDGDLVEVKLEYRPLGAAGWAVAAVARTPGAPDGDGELAWATADLPEGEYEVRGVASDQPANAPGEGLEAVAPPVLRIVVDRTAPEIEIVLLGDGAVRVHLADALSDIRALELLEDSRARFTARPEDGICDSRRESFRVELPDGGAAGLSVRGIDAAGNVVERALAPVPDSD